MEIAHKVKPFISFHGKLFYLKKKKKKRKKAGKRDRSKEPDTLFSKSD